MLFEYEISAPANTTQAAPVEELIKLTHGRIVHAEIFFPDNSAGQLHIAINDAIHQVWPLNTEGYIRGNNSAVIIERHYDLKQAPYEFTAKAWNTDDFYDHAAIIRFVMVPIETLLEEEQDRTWLRRIAERLGWKERRR